MAVGAIRDMNNESWYARLIMRSKRMPCVSQAWTSASTTAGAHCAGGSAFTISERTWTWRLDDRIFARRGDLIEHGVAPGLVDVAHVDFDAHAAGDAVDRAGKHIAHADGGDRIHRRRWIERAASTASAISAAARNASRRSGMSTAPAWPPSPSIWILRLAGAAMAVTTPKRNAALFEAWTLFDMQLGEGRIIALGQRDRRQEIP